ncbi:MAG: HAD family hydrolase [Simkaniaceae bacterium]|nr:HAD family hydrolase [Simkaniaceae bacterium]
MGTADKGTIALDIDGTITESYDSVPVDVVDYLASLVVEGWRVVFLTGRTLSFAMLALESLEFPFLLAVQNGADLFSIAKGQDHEKLRASHLDKDTVLMLDRFYEDRQGDFVVYAGAEKGDFCYYRPGKHSPALLTYLEKTLTRLCPQPWRAVEHFSIHEQNFFPMAKGFGTEAECVALQDEIRKIPGLHTSVIKDRTGGGAYLLVITNAEADKGKAVRFLMDECSLSRPLIVGGDDNNDLPLFREGDIRIAMPHATEALREMADLIAPPVGEQGIIEGIKQAIALCP